MHCRIPIVALGASLLGCQSVTVTPRSIREAAAPPEVRERVLATWREAIDLLNEFLASPFNLSLPRGRFELRDEEGMLFVTDGGARPIEVRCSTLGDLVRWAGGKAASLRRGFVVARIGSGKGDRAVENSLFTKPDGEAQPPRKVASLIAHETSHLVHGNGFWRNCGYLCEALFLWRCTTSSIEDRPRATSVEIGLFARSKGLSQDFEEALEPGEAEALLATYVLDPFLHVEHGPFPELASPRQGPPELERLHAHCALARAWFDPVLRRDGSPERLQDLAALRGAFETETLRCRLLCLESDPDGAKLEERRSRMAGILKEALDLVQTERLGKTLLGEREDPIPADHRSGAPAPENR
ncbi:MAG: hypothetical protein HY721_18120 [Planctomycetes bacterium]|nr:hypothetical protein [Planctomycetota bacterium]